MLSGMEKRGMINKQERLKSNSEDPQRSNVLTVIASPPVKKVSVSKKTAASEPMNKSRPKNSQPKSSKERGGNGFSLHVGSPAKERKQPATKSTG